jgi:1,6-anhydro-N-acetylmuramate kinase
MPIGELASWSSCLIEPIPVNSTGAYKPDPDRIEAAAFTGLAKQRLEPVAGNIQAAAVTSKAVFLTEVYSH